VAARIAGEAERLEGKVAHAMKMSPAIAILAFLLGTVEIIYKNEVGGCFSLPLAFFALLRLK
jgi:hypothetical protein